MNNESLIIPIASGKGGVGKSIITANLAVSLANAGYSTVAIDMDLGGSNLYSYLGLENIYPGIGDYLNSKKGKLNDYIVPTKVPNLRFLSGECRITFMANIPYAQKVKLLKEIKNISADFILLDLGAGTTFNTLDYFELSNTGIVISTFEKPSIMNTLSFIKNFIFRVIQKETAKNQKVAKIVKDAYKSSTESNPLKIKKVLELIDNIDSELAFKVREKCKFYQPRIIFNKGEHPKDLVISKDIEESVKDNLSLELCFFGFMFQDKNVEQATKKNQVLIEDYTDSIASKDINQIAQRIIKFKNNYIENSNERLQKDTQEKFESL